MSYQRLTPQRIIVIIACALLLVTVIIQQFAHKQETFASLQQLEPSASRYEPIPGSYPTYKLWDKDDNLLGYAVISSASGYGGPLEVWVSIDMNGSLRKVIIADHCETPSYLKRVLRADYLSQFSGKGVSSPFEPGRDIDLISGATYTTEGIAHAARKGAAHVGNEVLGIPVPSKSQLHLGWQEFGLVILYGLVTAGVSRKHHQLRPWVLAASVLFLGVIYNSALNLANLASLLSGNLPAFLEHPFWYLLTLGTLTLTLLGGKNFYCSWLCPFGGLQAGLYKALGFVQVNVSPRITALSHKIRWGLVWAAVMLALVYDNPGLAGYEPFAVSFGGQGNLGHWLTLCLVLLTSIFIYRVWCRFLCPVGALLNILATIKRKVKLLLRHTVAVEPRSDSASDQHLRCSEHSDCPAQAAGPLKTWPDLNNPERVFLGIMFVYIALIAMTLILNVS